MYIGRQSSYITLDIDKVYEIARTYPTFVPFFLKGSRVLSEDNRRLHVEVHSKLFGMKTVWRGRGLKKALKAIQFTQTQGTFRGLKARWSFLAKGRYETKVTICTSFKAPWLTPLGERLLGSLVVERVTSKILRELKRRCEYPSVMSPTHPIGASVDSIASNVVEPHD